ncbi:MAG TPA: D-alanyl-D-alanine carboxypeptidase/D-alanyl-D-alanine-endopeptidase [Flavitalea sp.]|nr:D-alanyl-D-alanine carboxypeptidase/D-alanyl-D-alanine-endopeptidase [Flavitalea sp.]
MIRVVFSVSLFFLLIACSTVRVGQTQNPTWIHDSTLLNAHIGIHIYDLGAARTVYDYQGDKYFVPASNIKILSCYAAMKYLGDSISSIEFAENDTALFIRPLGDPTVLHQDFLWQPAIKLMQQSSKNIYLIARNWNTKSFGAGWSWDDFNESYSAERNPFPVYGNVIKWIQKRTGETPKEDNVMDESVAIYSLPEVNWKVRFSTDTGSRNFFVLREKNENIFTITQSLQKKGEQDVPFITNGLQSAAVLLTDTVGKKIHITDKPVPSNLAFTIVHSQPLDSILRPMMFRSDNFFAEQILLMVSQKLFGVMDDSKVIAHIERNEFARLPQPPAWADGSGLSRYNLVSPRDFTTVLGKMEEEFGMQRLMNLFPTGGIGTLEDYYKQDSGYIFAKTGTLTGVLALSGFMITSKGKEFVFSILINNHRGDAAQIRTSVERFLHEVRRKN